MESDGSSYTVRIAPGLDPDDLAAVAAAVVKAVADNGADFGLVLEYCRRVK